MLRTLRFHGGATDDVLVLHDGLAADEDAPFRADLESLGPLRLLQVPPVPVPPHIAGTVREARNVANFVRLHLWNLTDYDRLAFVDGDMLFIRDVSSIRNLPCHSAVPQSAGTVNGGLMVLCPDKALGAALMKRLQESKVGERYPTAEQDFLSTFINWRFVSTCFNARGGQPGEFDYFPLLRSYVHKHKYFWPPRDICPLHKVVLLHFVGPVKPWHVNSTQRYHPEILAYYTNAVYGDYFGDSTHASQDDMPCAEGARHGAYRRMKGVQSTKHALR
eukprot:SM000281S10753  [mRNA]  locus=s281:35314:36861:- [translate_table: standard]